MLPLTQDPEPDETTRTPQRPQGATETGDLDPDDSSRRPTRPYRIELGFESTD